MDDEDDEMEGSDPMDDDQANHGTCPPATGDNTSTRPQAKKRGAMHSGATARKKRLLSPPQPAPVSPPPQALTADNAVDEAKESMHEQPRNDGGCNDDDAGSQGDGGASCDDEESMAHDGTEVSPATVCLATAPANPVSSSSGSSPRFQGSGEHLALPRQEGHNDASVVLGAAFADLERCLQLASRASMAIQATITELVHKTRRQATELTQAKHEAQQQATELTKAKHEAQQQATELTQAKHEVQQQATELTQAKHEAQQQATELTKAKHEAQQQATELTQAKHEAH